MWITVTIASIFATVSMARAGAKLKSSPSGSGSPRRRKREGKPTKGKVIDAKASVKKPSACTLTICHFHDILDVEMIIFERNDGEDGFLNFIRLYTMDEKECEILDELGITRLVPRRNPNTANDIMLGRKGYWRQLIIRYNGGTSNSESRQNVLNKLKTFFLNPAYSAYPPPHIDTIDITNTENPIALDEYFTDNDIELIMKEDIEEEDLTNSFVSNFPDVAKICWSGQHVSDWARSLGFPLNETNASNFEP